MFRKTTWASIFVGQEFVMSNYLNKTLSDDNYISKYKRMNGNGFALSDHNEPTAVVVQISNRDNYVGKSSTSGQDITNNATFVEGEINYPQVEVNMMNMPNYYYENNVTNMLCLI
jgi:hypothetical protein